jgi:hypothetical protein
VFVAGESVWQRVPPAGPLTAVASRAADDLRALAGHALHTKISSSKPAISAHLSA